MIDPQSKALFARARKVGECIARSQLRMMPTSAALRDASVIWGRHPGSFPVVIWPDGSKLVVTPGGRLYLLDKFGDDETVARNVRVNESGLQAIYEEFIGEYPTSK